MLRTPPQGTARARNAGIAEATGEFILPLDADDRIRPAFLEKTLAPLRDSEVVGIVDTEAERFGEASGAWARPPFRMPNFLLGNTIAPAALYRRADYRRTRGYNPNMSRGWEDFDFWLSLLELDKVAARVPEVLFDYRIRSESTSHRMTPADWRFCYGRLLRNHPRLYAAHPSILPRLALRFAFGRIL